MKLQRCDPRPFVCGYSAEIITLLFFVFALNSSLVKTNKNRIIIIYAEKVSDCYIASNGAFILVYFIGGGIAILCFYVMGPWWIRSNKTLPLTKNLLRWLRGPCCYLYTCQVRENKLHSCFSFDEALKMYVYLCP